jgi:hypothetical protein
MDKFTDYQGAWHDAICDHLRGMKKPAVNPFPNDPSFKWEEFIINPDWEPSPKAECHLQFWSLEKLMAATGMKQKLFRDWTNPSNKRPV